MICMKCGRELTNGAVYCKGCGAPAKQKPGRRARSGAASVFGLPTSLAGLPVGQVVTLAISLMFLLAAMAVALPVILTKAPPPETVEPPPVVSGEVNNPGDMQDTPQLVPKSGLVLVLDAGEDAEIVNDDAYDDGTTYQVILVDNGALQIINQRLAASPGGILGQLPHFYPYLEQQPQIIEEDFTFGDFPVVRVKLEAEEATFDMIIDLIFVNTGEYDHVIQIETPQEDYPRYEKRIQEIINSIRLENMEPEESGAAA